MTANRITSLRELLQFWIDSNIEMPVFEPFSEKNYYFLHSPSSGILLCCFCAKVLTTLNRLFVFLPQDDSLHSSKKSNYLYDFSVVNTQVDISCLLPWWQDGNTYYLNFARKLLLSIA